MMHVRLFDIWCLILTVFLISQLAYRLPIDLMNLGLVVCGSSVVGCSFDGCALHGCIICGV